jgi:hypothetical protein
MNWDNIEAADRPELTEAHGLTVYAGTMKIPRRLARNDIFASSRAQRGILTVPTEGIA